MKSKLWIFVLTVCLGLTLSLGGTSQALEIVDGKKIMVFGGRQPAPNIDPSLKTAPEFHSGKWKTKKPENRETSYGVTSVRM